jgi:uncharacterized protein (DUF849 family)
MKKIFDANITFDLQYERKYFFIIIKKVLSLNLSTSHLLYSIDEKTARNTIVLSDFWKTKNMKEMINVESDLGKFNYSIENKKLELEEVTNASLLYLADHMLVEDFMEYISELRIKSALL